MSGLQITLTYRLINGYESVIEQLHRFESKIHGIIWLRN